MYMAMRHVFYDVINGLKLARGHENLVQNMAMQTQQPHPPLPHHHMCYHQGDHCKFQGIYTTIKKKGSNDPAQLSVSLAWADDTQSIQERHRTKLDLVLYDWQISPLIWLISLHINLLPVFPSHLFQWKIGRENICSVKHYGMGKD